MGSSPASSLFSSFGPIELPPLPIDATLVDTHTTSPITKSINELLQKTSRSIVADL